MSAITIYSQNQELDTLINTFGQSVNNLKQSYVDICMNAKELNDWIQKNTKKQSEERESAFTYIEQQYSIGKKTFQNWASMGKQAALLIEKNPEEAPLILEMDQKTIKAKVRESSFQSEDSHKPKAKPKSKIVPMNTPLNEVTQERDKYKNDAGFYKDALYAIKTALCAKGENVWIGVCKAAGIDPKAL